MKRHPSLERIYQAVGRDGAEAEVVRHVAECPRCAAAAAWVEDLLAIVSRGPLPQPDPAALDRAIAIAEAPGAAPTRKEASRGWSLARLARDAFVRPALAGVRGEGAGQRFLYESEGGHLDLEISAAPGDAERRRLTGQLVVEGRGQADEVLVVLWGESRVVARATGDELGIFVLDDLAPGTYRLEALAPATGLAVRVEALTVDGSA